MLPISKSTFLQFQICPKDTWLRLHKPELVETFTLTEFEKHLLEQGNEVEACARQLFPGALLEILRPAPGDVLLKYPISKRVNSSRTSDEDKTLISQV